MAIGQVFKHQARAFRLWVSILILVLGTGVGKVAGADNGNAFEAGPVVEVFRDQLAAGGP
jgi:hypothetical protein